MHNLQCSLVHSYIDILYLSVLKTGLHWLHTEGEWHLRFIVVALSLVEHFPHLSQVTIHRCYLNTYQPVTKLFILFCHTLTLIISFCKVPPDFHLFLRDAPQPILKGVLQDHKLSVVQR
nr:hypothetical protein Iba_scaffold17868CG0010 [Ipomoea batatas]